MGYFYFDESIHSRAGLIVGAFVHTEAPLEPAVAAVLRRLGLQPGIDEYKSGTRIPTDPVEAKLREDLRDEIQRLYGRVGLLVAPSTDRHLLARDAMAALKKLLSTNTFDSRAHTAYFDEGVFTGSTVAHRLAIELDLSELVTIEPSVDSRVVGGIQVADLAAHTMATMLLECLGLVKKQVKAGPNSGYEPDLEFELGFELWASLRYQLFSRTVPEAPNGSKLPGPVHDVASCGLYVSERCNEELRHAAHARFGSVYLGCIH